MAVIDPERARQRLIAAHIAKATEQARRLEEKYGIAKQHTNERINTEETDR